MSLFGDLAGSLLGQGGQSLIASHLTDVLNDQGGGVGGIVQRFQQAGLGSVVQSWVGNGPNAQVSPDQVHSALGPDLIAQLTQRTGLPIESLLPLVAQYLPGVIDHSTPGGQVPASGQVQAPPAAAGDTAV